MDSQREATAGADRDAVAGDGSPAIVSVGDDDAGEIAVRTVKAVSASLGWLPAVPAC
jgi:hypothetical protein